ncbi:hypothetical protein LOD99_10074 [Oopsacas minuta]|uniref:Uncharacterized protein n=1 Tax=Oopsacas minuta TaxID=111878 RepID=A0AAV7KIP3_9METZ|nr:hypothetical protein LOD99_10074 [Oopsacas minuta]
MLELIRVAQSRNTDYLRESGLSSLKRVIKDFQNPDLLDAQGFSAIPQLPPTPSSFIPSTQVSERLQVARRQETVYSPTKNFPLRHCPNTNLFGSSENVDERSVSQAYQVSEAVDYIHPLVGKPEDFEAIHIAVSGEDESDISEVTSHLSEGDVSPWNKRFHEVENYIIAFLYKHNDESFKPRLLETIHQGILLLVSQLFPQEMVLRVQSTLGRDLNDILS